MRVRELSRGYDSEKRHQTEASEGKAPRDDLSAPPGEIEHHAEYRRRDEAGRESDQ
jgi:hypothetical protein